MEKTDFEACNCACVTCAGVAIGDNPATGAATAYSADGELLQITATQWGATTVVRVGVKIPDDKAVPDTIVGNLQVIESYTDSSGNPIGPGRKLADNYLVSGNYTWEVPEEAEPGDTLWFSIFGNFYQHLDTWSRGGTVKPGSSGTSTRVISYEAIAHPNYGSSSYSSSTSVPYDKKISGWVGSDSITIKDQNGSTIMPGFAPGTTYSDFAQLLPNVSTLSPSSGLPAGGAGPVTAQQGAMLIQSDGSQFFSSKVLQQHQVPNTRLLAIQSPIDMATR